MSKMSPWAALGDAAARWRAPPARAVLCLIVIALLTTPEARGGEVMMRGAPLRRARRAPATAAPPAAAGAGARPSPGSVPRLWQSLSLRGGGDIHHAEVDLGHGNKVVVRAWSDGGAVATSLTASCDGFEVQWGVALGQMDSWSHARTAQGGKYAALVPPGSRDHLGTAVRTPLAAGASLVLDSRSCGQRDDELWGLRFIIVEATSGKLYPPGGMTLFSPLKEGVDMSYVIKPDYGSLEERLAKRQNLPIELEGDHGRDQITVGNDNDGGADRNHVEALHVHAAHIDTDVGSLLHQAANRILPWVNGDKGHGLGGPSSGAMGGGPAQGPAVVPDGCEVLCDLAFESAGEDGSQIPARLVAFIPAPDDAGAHASPLPVTVRAFPKDTGSGRLRGLTMHWGAGIDGVGDWGRPSDDMLPPHSERAKNAVQTALQPAQGGEAEAEGWHQVQGLVQETRLLLPPNVQALNFVLKSGDQWYKTDGGNDFQIRVPSAAGQGPGHNLQGYTDVGALSLKYQPIFEFEGRGGLALMERFQASKAFLEGLSLDDPKGLAAVFVWLRFSQVRQLAWQRKHNTKPRELGWAIEDLSKTIAWKWRHSDGTRRELLRQLISTVPRGGGDGQAIRDYILVIMRKFEIKKRKGTFMEEWHQKLHNNSTPDDIYICEAYLEFLRTHGDLNAFYAHLFKHGIDRKRLQTYDRPILQEPHYFPTIRNGLSNELRKYLEILKSVHSGSDLRRLLNTCKHIIGDHVASNAAASLDYGGDVSRGLGALSRAVEARRSIAEQMVKEGDGTKMRDLLYLDLALESQSRLIIESTLPQVSGAQLPLWLALAAESLLVTLRFSSGAGGRSVEEDCEGEGCDEWRSLDSALKREFEELREALGDLMELVKAHGADVGGWVSGGDKWGALWGAAIVERVQRALGGLVDRQQSLLQAVAEEIGGGLRKSTPDKRPEGWSVTMFTEEVVRGGMAFAVSGLMRKLEAEIRAAGGLSAWQIVSPGTKTATGVLRAVVLKDVQEEEYAEPTVLLARSITGEEEIPPGVVAVITPDAVDVLSHVSVRARQLKVLFASCFDPLALDPTSQLVGEVIKCSIAGDKVEVSKSAPGAAVPGDAASTSAAAAAAAGGGAVDLKVCAAQSSAYCMQEGELSAGEADMCGAKTNNLLHLRKLLAAAYGTPASAVVPFGSLDKTMGDAANAAAKAQYEAAVGAALKGNNERIGSTLSDVQRAIVALAEPKGMQEQVLAAMRSIEGDNADWRGAFDTIKRVWASTWNERAFIACRKASIDPRRIQMCVLVQKIVEAQYAFVLHTVNPTTSDASEMYGEIVVGQGEALVGNAPGRAFGFACGKHDGGEPVVKSLPSKGAALWGKGWIFRSDSNAEDLPGFAGAGLFDSFPVVEHSTSTVAYRNEKLVSDRGFAMELMRALRDLALEVEQKMGGVPQDIEGCYRDGKIWVVQTRPQVGLG